MLKSTPIDEAKKRLPIVRKMMSMATRSECGELEINVMNLKSMTTSKFLSR